MNSTVPAFTETVDWGIDIDAYQQGWSDCKLGIPHQDKGESYNRGYRARYEQEQMKSARSVSHG